MLALLFLLLISCQASCPRDADRNKVCAGHGGCTVDGVCVCDAKHTGADCSLVKCPTGIAWSGPATETNTVHVDAECSNRGKCDFETGVCDCDFGFQGTACQRLECPNACSGQGTCVSMRSHATHNIYGPDRVYDSIWDADKIFGCQCDRGFKGADCSLLQCPTGDDPLTLSQVNEVQLLSCTATSGSFDLLFKRQRVAIQYDSTALQFQKALESLPTITQVGITFSSGTTVCNAASINVVSIEFQQEFGPQPPLKAYYTNTDNTLTISSGAKVSIYVGGDSFGGLQSITGTKEGDDCSNRGTCNAANGMCECYLFPMPGFRSSNGYGLVGERGDCGAADNQNYYGGAIVACPGEIACNGHGYCSGSPSFACTCDSNWFGGDCSLRQCPKGLSWFDIPSANNDAHNTFTICSDGGNCDTTTGQCICFEPFEGPACEHMKCPGQGCSGHGICMTIEQLALESKLNGDSTDYTYGLDPNAAATWDSNKIFTCKCDEGYGGHDCADILCPRGDDPVTSGQVDEIQVLECTATGGSFQLSFRSAQTSLIPFDAAEVDIEAALESLVTIDDVQVEYTSGTVACSDQSTPHYILVTFLTNHADLPSLLPNVDALTGGINVATDGQVLGTANSVTGTKEDAMCSNKGNCNYFSGECVCAQGFGSSDSRGNIGNKGDCGFRLPYANIE